MHRPAVSYQFDDVILNPEAFSVEKSGRALALEPKSIRLLLYLIQNRSRAIGKEELLRTVWELSLIHISSTLSISKFKARRWSCRDR